MSAKIKRRSLFTERERERETSKKDLTSLKVNSVLKRESSEPFSTSILLKNISEISCLFCFGMSFIR